MAEALSGDLLDLRMAQIERDYQRDLLRGALFVLILILATLAILKFSVGEIDRDGFGPLVFILSWMSAVFFFANMIIARQKAKNRRLLVEKELGVSEQAKQTAELPQPQSVIPPASVTESTTTRLSQKPPVKKQPERS